MICPNSQQIVQLTTGVLLHFRLLQGFLEHSIQLSRSKFKNPLYLFIAWENLLILFKNVLIMCSFLVPFSCSSLSLLLNMSTSWGLQHSSSSGMFLSYSLSHSLANQFFLFTTFLIPRMLRVA